MATREPVERLTPWCARAGTGPMDSEGQRLAMPRTSADCSLTGGSRSRPDTADN